MTEPREPIAEFESLLTAAIDGRLSEPDRTRLEQLLEKDDFARESYLEHVVLHAMLRWEHALPLGVEARNAQDIAPATDDSEPAQMPAITETLSAFPVLLDTLPSSRTAFSVPLGGFLFSYCVAAVVVTVGILIGWAYQVSTPPSNRQEVAQQPPRPDALPRRSEPETFFVGRITGIVDCRWADPRTAPVGFDGVVLGRKYALASGLLEITYDTGAKVILEGPCTYQVESKASGYLLLGKLTAKVEKRGERRGEREANVATHQSSIFNLQSSISPLPSPLFSIRIPTATITDLGTEFGVEVDKSGAGNTRVYQGKVELRVSGGAAKDAQVIRLGENESARVEVGKNRVARVVRETGQPVRFVRQLPKRIPITLFNTGVHVKDGKPDPHWQLVARSDDPKFKPQPALVETPSDPAYLTNDPDRSQWISAVASHLPLRNGVFFTFRTTFDLTGMRPSTAVLHGRFIADNHVRAIRLNGCEIAVLQHGYTEFGFYHVFSSSRGFIEGVNVLEVEVENGSPDLGLSSKSSSPMCLLVELEGSVIPAWSETPRSVSDVKPTVSKN